ncbi:hypothetical protein Pcinc_000588 [Petrolisthes cinctipes]|uniref:Uncharacterized protein n=1 Tax=Petrolisthes cinctipes TaxID=88211 RepID=A0AAE1GMX3_PETCI|nr:hypothetical protein Pcinc_000588 [Petrolisthes cinctipes]
MQSRASVACKSVNTCKSALLAIKARSVTDTLKRLSNMKAARKAVMFLEERGDSYLTDLATRLVYVSAQPNIGYFEDESHVNQRPR